MKLASGKTTVSLRAIKDIKNALSALVGTSSLIDNPLISKLTFSLTR